MAFAESHPCAGRALRPRLSLSPCGPQEARCYCRFHSRGRNRVPAGPPHFLWTLWDPTQETLGGNHACDTCGPLASADTQRRGALRPGGPGGGEGTGPGPGPRAQRGWWEQSPRTQKSETPGLAPRLARRRRRNRFIPLDGRERFRSDAVFCAKGAAGVRGQAVNTADKLWARKI